MKIDIKKFALYSSKDKDSIVSRSYCGDGKYIFISFSHADKAKVIPMISNLQKFGFNIAFNGEADLGDDENLALGLANSSLMIAIISSAYLNDQNLIDELKFSIDEKIKRVLIYIEDIDLPLGLRMRLGRQQAIKYWQYMDKYEFYNKLVNSHEMLELKTTDEVEEKNEAEIQTVFLGDGSTYCGEIKNGKLHGKGKKIWPNGDSYDGDWEEGQMHGNGKYTWVSGNVYIGSFYQDQITGFGIKFLINGDIYEGQWCNGRCEGIGTYKWENGEYYDGEWLNDKCHGKGKYFWLNGDVYEGDWVEDSRTGEGVFISGDGKFTYTGEFFEDEMHGQGKMMFSDGSTKEGTWVNGNFVG